MEPEPSRRRGVWWALVVFTLVVVPFALEGIHTGDTDTFYHLANGRYMVEHGQILDREVFSFTRLNEPWTNYYWLFEWILYRLYELGGYPAVIGLRAAIVLLTTNLLFWLIYRRSERQSLLTLAFSLAAFAHYIPRGINIRPHLVSYLFLTASLLLLDRFEARPRSIEPWLPILCVFWANLHGIEYPVIIAVVAIYCFTALLPFGSRLLTKAGWSREVRRWPLLLVACALAFLVNPFGVKLLHTALIARNQEVMSFIIEMKPYSWRALFSLAPDTHLYSLVTLNYVMLTALFVLPAWIRQRDWRAILLGALGTVLLFQRIRFHTEFTILVTPVVAGAVARLQWNVARRRWVVAGLLAVFALYLGFAAGMTVFDHYRRGHFAALVSSTAYPEGPVRFLRAEGLTGNLVGDPRDGGYLEWALYPHVRIAMDMRTPEPFDRQILWMMRTVNNPQLFRNIQAHWPVDFVLLRRDSSQLSSARREGSGFTPVWVDDQFVLLMDERQLGARHADLPLRHLDTFVAVPEVIPATAYEGLRAEAHHLLRIWPDNHLAHRAELSVLLARGEYDALRDAARVLATAYPDQPAYPYYAGLAAKVTDQGRAAALAQFERALAIDPNFDLAYPELAETALRLGRYRVGLDVMERYVLRRAYQLSAREYLLLGDLRSQAGDPARAIEAYERALWLTAEDRPVRSYIENNLSGAYLDTGRADLAMPLLKAALSRRPSFPEAEFNTARALEMRGSTDEARSAFERLAGDESAPASVRARAQARLREGFHK